MIVGINSLNYQKCPSVLYHHTLIDTQTATAFCYQINLNYQYLFKC